jgi:hypothetical protein
MLHLSVRAHTIIASEAQANAKRSSALRSQ